jgi:hypothetical protein
MECPLRWVDVMRLTHLALLASSLVACAGGPLDELAGEDGDSDGKADGSVPSYFLIAHNPTDEGFQASRPNKATTRCSADFSGPACAVRSIDLAGTGLTDTAALFERLFANDPIIVRATLGIERPTRRTERVLAIANADLIGDLTSVIAPFQPMVSHGAENGPDCLFAELDVSRVSIMNSTLAVETATDEAVNYRGSLSNVTITGTARFAITCVDGTAPVEIHIDRVDVAGQVLIQPDGLIAQIVQSATPTGVTVQANVPSAIFDMLDLRGTGAETVMATTARAALDAVVVRNAQPALELATSEVWLPGFQITDEDEDVENVFVLAKNAGDHIREQRLNSIRGASIDQIDFDVANATEESRAAARAALDGDGVILAGTRFLKDDQAGRTAERFWLRAANP